MRKALGQPNSLTATKPGIQKQCPRARVFCLEPVGGGRFYFEADLFYLSAFTLKEGDRLVSSLTLSSEISPLGLRAAILYKPTESSTAQEIICQNAKKQ